MAAVYAVVRGMTLITMLLLTQIPVPVPIITFPAPPPLVIVQPGVQVVEDNDDEVFFHDNFYWVRREGRWFKSRDHKGNWVVVDAPVVPPALVKLTPGQYRRYKKAVKEEMKEERREEKEERKAAKHGKKGKG
jgi:hypothetical protein